MKVFDLDRKLTTREFIDLIDELTIRFNTNPQKYEKKDYEKLIEAILGAKSILDQRIDAIDAEFSGNFDITSSDPDALKVLRGDNQNFILAPQICTQIPESTEDDNKLVTVQTIKNYVNNSLNWQLL